MIQQLHAYLSGLVQGVGLRNYVQQQAEALGLTGFVRNLADGRVEVVAEGEPQLLEALLARLQAPTVGRVDRVQVERGPGSGRFRDFAITY